MESLNASLPTPPELLVYWIIERWNVLQKKEYKEQKPWSSDSVFQTTYFCNVHRENDTVTRWLRNRWGMYVEEENYELAMIMARFINWPETLEYVGFPFTFNPKHIKSVLDDRMEKGYKTWGNAYVITTHGLRMGKPAYLVGNVLEGARHGYRKLLMATRGPALGHSTPRLENAYSALIQLEGLGSFLAAQVIADLKNTSQHPLKTATDWKDWASHGPGSLRGMSWFFYGEPGKISPGQFKEGLKKIRNYVDSKIPSYVPEFCNQDLQNCLCEFDKYMRVKNGTGRSKRGYPGI